VYKCLRAEHLSRLNFILSCLDELSERIDILVYNDALGTDEAADVFKTILNRTSPWTENQTERTETQQLDLEETSELDMTHVSAELVLEAEEKSDSDMNVGVEDSGADPCVPCEERFLVETKVEKMDHSCNGTVESDEVSEYNSPILKAEFEPYAGESLSQIVASPKLTPTIFEPIRDTPPQLRRVRFTLSETNQSDTSVVKEQTSDDVFIADPPVLKRANHHFGSGNYARLIHKFEAISGPATHTQSTLAMPQPNNTKNSDSHGVNKAATIESEKGPSPTSNVHFCKTVTNSEVDQMNSANGSMTTASCRTPTRALRTYRDCADTLKAMMQRSPCSTTIHLKNNSPRKSAEDSEGGLVVNASYGDESFDEASFTGERLQNSQVDVPSLVSEATNWPSTINDGVHVPVPIRSSGRYKNLPDYVLSNS
jgi:hypothetical protein